MIFNTKVQGIPCKCEVLDCSPNYDIRLLNQDGTPNLLASALVSKEVYEQLLEDYRADQAASYWRAEA